MSSFKPGREQDASDVIRGFTYQVDTTIERWLTLKSNEELILEFGEDIDKIVRGLSPDGDNYELSLEQVKALAKQITLNSPEIREVVSNYVAHIMANPNVNFSFLFTTTATATREKPALFQDNSVKGIERWQQLSNDDRLSATEISESIEGIRQCFRNGARPSRYNEKSWRNFQGWLDKKSEDQILEAIKRFRWNLSSPSATGFEERLVSLIETQSYANNRLQAQGLYERFFFSVYTLLSTPGEKKLTPDTRNKVLAAPTLSEMEQANLNILMNRVRDESIEKAQTEARLRYISQLVNAAHQQVFSVRGRVAVLRMGGPDAQKMANSEKFASDLQQGHASLLKAWSYLNEPVEPSDAKYHSKDYYSEWSLYLKWSLAAIDLYSEWQKHGDDNLSGKQVLINEGGLASAWQLRLKAQRKLSGPISGQVVTVLREFSEHYRVKGNVTEAAQREQQADQIEILLR